MNLEIRHVVHSTPNYPIESRSGAVLQSSSRLEQRQSSLPQPGSRVSVSSVEPAAPAGTSQRPEKEQESYRFDYHNLCERCNSRVLIYYPLTRPLGRYEGGNPVRPDPPTPPSPPLFWRPKRREKMHSLTVSRPVLSLPIRFRPF